MFYNLFYSSLVCIVLKVKFWISMFRCSLLDFYPWLPFCSLFPSSLPMARKIELLRSWICYMLALYFWNCKLTRWYNRTLQFCFCAEDVVSSIPLHSRLDCHGSQAVIHSVDRIAAKKPHFPWLSWKCYYAPQPSMLYVASVDSCLFSSLPSGSCLPPNFYALSCCLCSCWTSLFACYLDSLFIKFWSLPSPLLSYMVPKIYMLVAIEDTPHPMLLIFSYSAWLRLVWNLWIVFIFLPSLCGSGFLAEISLWTEEVVQFIKYWPHKREDLSLIPH